MPHIDYIGVGLDEKQRPMQVFHLMADGGANDNRRPVLVLGVDDDNKIWTAALVHSGTPRVWQKTSGIVHRHDPQGMDPETAVWADIVGAWEPNTGICMGHLYEYITPRLVTYMARAYVPLQLSEAAGWTHTNDNDNE